MGGPQADRQIPAGGIEYRAPGHLALVGVLAVVVVVVAVAVWRAGDTLFQSLFNTALALDVPCWVGYAAFFIIAYRITVSDGRVRWSAVFRRGVWDVSEMTSVRSRMPGLARLRFGIERSIAVQTGYGFSRFVEGLTTAYSTIRVNTGPLDRLR